MVLLPFVLLHCFVVAPILIVFVVLMLIFVFVDFSVLLLLPLLCCYVVNLGKAKKTKKIKHPKKVEVLPGIFYKTSYGCNLACAKAIVFFFAVLLFFLVAQKAL